jgi:hypothetical protein
MTIDGETYFLFAVVPCIEGVQPEATSLPPENDMRAAYGVMGVDSVDTKFR